MDRASNSVAISIAVCSVGVCDMCAVGTRRDFWWPQEHPCSSLSLHCADRLLYHDDRCSRCDRIMLSSPKHGLCTCLVSLVSLPSFETCNTDSIQWSRLIGGSRSLSSKSLRTTTPVERLAAFKRTCSTLQVSRLLSRHIFLSHGTVSF